MSAISQTIDPNQIGQIVAAIRKLGIKLDHIITQLDEIRDAND